MRIGILRRLILGALLFLWGGLFLTQVISGPRYRRQAERNRTRLIHLPAARGSILDRRGTALVKDQIGFELAVLPREVKNSPDLWERLKPFVHLSPEELAYRYRREYQAPYAPVSLVKDIPAQDAFALEEEKDNLAGTLLRPIPERHYLQGAAIGPVAGYLGLIAPEELTHLKSYGYTFRDLIGRDGLEQQYDDYLRGRDGGLQVEVDARGRLVRELGFLKPERGRNITISLDERLQLFCYDLMKEKTGALIVMEAQTGEILSLVTTPTFDPNAFIDSQRRMEVRRYLHSVGRPMFHRAIRAMVPPGSTFKAAVAYGALESRKIQPETTVECTGSLQLGQTVFHCWLEAGHGLQTVTDALEHSCNLFFYQTGRRLGAEGIHQAARLFGLGRPTGIDLPRESEGLVPDPEWMRQTMQRQWQPGDTLSFAIGQGSLKVTPLQMLMLFNAIGTGGVVPTPHLLMAMEGEKQPATRTVNHLPLDPSALATVRRGLEQVVSSSSGTGRLAQIAGISVSGKTGTAQVPKGLSHAWFCGYSPSQHPRVSFVVFLEHGGKGGEQGALVIRELLIYLKELGYL